jgi:transposase-like protein
MSRKRFTAEQIITHLREAEVLLSKGKTVGVVCRQLNVSENTYYRWRREYSGLEVDQAKRLKEIEKENQRLKKLVAEQALDIAILKEASRGNF